MMVSILMLGLLAAALNPDEHPTGPTHTSVTRVGDWSVRVELTPIGDRRVRAPSHREVIYRDGPAGSQRLGEMTGTGGFQFFLGENGLLLLQGAAELPQLYWPGDPTPTELILPRPETLDARFDASPYVEKAFMLGDVLFYERSGYPGQCLVIGFVEVDVPRKRIVRSCVLLEVTHRWEASLYTTAASLFGPPVRMGDFVLWRNRGYGPAVKGEWSESRVRCARLSSGKMCDPRELPRGFLEAFERTRHLEADQ